MHAVPAASHRRISLTFRLAKLPETGGSAPVTEVPALSVVPTAAVPKQAVVRGEAQSQGVGAGVGLSKKQLRKLRRKQATGPPQGSNNAADIEDRSKPTTTLHSIPSSGLVGFSF